LEKCTLLDSVHAQGRCQVTTQQRHNVGFSGAA
jgi:hypothetical protein